MAKSKKSKRAAKPRPANRPKPANRAVDVNRKIAAPRQSAKKQAATFREEYAYVVKDLRHVLILAAVMFALLIALNLVLQ